MKNTYGYKDLEKLKQDRKGQKRRYYGKTAYLYAKRPWSQMEIDLVMAHEIPDAELSAIIERSLGAIQIKRSQLKKEGY